MAFIELETVDDVGWIVLDRPESANAIHRPMLSEFHAALTRAVAPESRLRALVISGRGEHFCSGIDLHALLATREVSAEHEPMTRDYLDHLLQRLANAPLPVIAAVNGAAAGAGMTLALTADIVVASEHAYFAPSFLRMGLVPDNGVSCLLRERIGEARTRALLLLGERLEASKALDWGLIHACVSSQHLRAKAQEIGKSLSSVSPRIVNLTRQMLNKCCAGEIQRDVAVGRDRQSIALQGTECVDAVAAFFKNRSSDIAL